MRKFSLYKWFITFIALLFGIILFKIDPSTTPLNSHVSTDSLNQSNLRRLPVVLVTYADGHAVFFKNQRALTASIADKGVDYIFNYSRNQIDSNFYEKNKDILAQPCGRGFWLWKPYFILKTMEAMPDNAIILYADSGVIFKKSIHKILKLLDKVPLILVGHGSVTPLRKHIKREALKFFDIKITEKILNSQNIWAFFIALRNTPENRVLIRQWLEICQNKDALTNQPMDPAIQDSDFIAHQHDQSLLSILTAVHPTDQYIIIPRSMLRKQYGIHNFHRHPNRQYESPLFIMAGMPLWISTIVWNNPMMKLLRKNLIDN